MTPLELWLFILLIAAVGYGLWQRSRRLALQARQGHEMTEQRRQRDVELQAQAERTTALFDRMVEGIIIVDFSGRIRLCNQAIGQFFEFSKASVGRTVLEATRHHEVASLVTRLQLEPEVLNHELRIEGVTETRFLQVNALALVTAEGAHDGAILVFHDLTRLRRLVEDRKSVV